MNEPGEEFAVYSHASQRDQGLPPDPEEMNGTRSDLAFYAMREFAAQSGTDPEAVLKDLLTDLMHWCDRHGHSFRIALDSAQNNYIAETATTQPESSFPIQPSLEPTNPNHEVKMPF